MPGPEGFEAQAAEPGRQVVSDVLGRRDDEHSSYLLKVVQPGYELNGRLLRPARVIVARAPA